MWGVELGWTDKTLNTPLLWAVAMAPEITAQTNPIFITQSGRRSSRAGRETQVRSLLSATLWYPPLWCGRANVALLPPIRVYRFLGSELPQLADLLGCLIFKLLLFGGKAYRLKLTSFVLEPQPRPLSLLLVIPAHDLYAYGKMYLHD